MGKLEAEQRILESSYSALMRTSLNRRPYRLEGLKLINQDQGYSSNFKEIFAKLTKAIVNSFKEFCKQWQSTVNSFKEFYKQWQSTQEQPAILKGKLASWKAVASAASLYRPVHNHCAEPTVAYLRRHRHSEL